jgi:hypothetical protein
LQATLTPGSNAIASMRTCFLLHVNPVQFRTCMLRLWSYGQIRHACTRRVTLSSAHLFGLYHHLQQTHPHLLSLSPSHKAPQTQTKCLPLPSLTVLSAHAALQSFLASFTYASERISWAPHPLPSHPSPLKSVYLTEKYLYRHTRPSVCIRDRGRINCRVGGDGCRLIIGLLG